MAHSLKSYAVGALTAAALLGLMARPASYPAESGSHFTAASAFTKLYGLQGVSVGELRSKYADASRTVKVLIIPGHDDTGGSEFRSLRESDLNARLALEIYLLLLRDGHFAPILSRLGNTYLEPFSSYFSSEENAIWKFIKSRTAMARDLVRRGIVETHITIHHPAADPEVRFRLYGFNKWANDGDVDIVLNVHFNDYPGRPIGRRGEYSGFTVYVPDSAFPNYEASRTLGRALFERLKGVTSPSDMPEESGGFLEDQKLIAVGANASLRSAVALIEYSYIYESRLTEDPLIFKKLAEATYEGLLDVLR